MDVRSSEADEPVDVLIVTAADDEDKAVRDVSLLKDWREIKADGHTGFDYWRGSLPDPSDRHDFKLALCKSPSMGIGPAGHVASLLTERLRPRCLAMCGVCAGRPGWVELGDVIFAETVYQYDLGEEVNEAPGAPPKVYRDLQTYPVRVPWPERAKNLQVPPGADWLRMRPSSPAIQREWLLRELLVGSDPTASPGRAQHCPGTAWPQLVEGLCREQLVTNDGRLKLTAVGRKEVKQLKVLHPDGLPTPTPFQVHVGPLGTGTRLIRDVDVWERLRNEQRRLFGFDMEASVIGLTGFLTQTPFVVVKGVMDFAEPARGQGWRKLAARAAAEVLIAFLRENLASSNIGITLAERKETAAATGHAALGEALRLLDALVEATPASERAPFLALKESVGRSP